MLQKFKIQLLTLFRENFQLVAKTQLVIASSMLVINKAKFFCHNFIAVVFFVTQFHALLRNSERKLSYFTLPSSVTR